MFGAPKHIVEKLKRSYSIGTRVELVRMEDEYSKLKPGDRGTVTGVDDIGTIHIDWDCGSSLGVAYGEDSCRKVLEWYKVWIVVPGTDGDAENGPCEPTWWNDFIQASSEADAIEKSNTKEKVSWEEPDPFGFSEKEAGGQCPVCTEVKRATEEEYKAWKAEMDAFPEPPFI